jgi:hypothetical protein
MDELLIIESIIFNQEPGIIIHMIIKPGQGGARTNDAGGVDRGEYDGVKYDGVMYDAPV